MIGPRYNALGADWVIFYTAARAFFAGQIAHVYDQAWLTPRINSLFANWLSSPLPYPAFHYPPSWLLLVLPFCAMPPVASLIGMLVTSFTGLVAALRKMFGNGGKFLFFAVSILLCPATANNVLAGQNGFLTCALLAGGFALLEECPIFAGILLGLLSFKPQMAFLAPIALIAAREWRALAAAIASGATLVLLSAAVFGADTWFNWIDVILHPSHVMLQNGLEWGRLWDESVFTCAMLLGASKPVANALQASAMVTASMVVYWSFRRAHLARYRVAIILAATVVASPHVSPYDMLPLTLAASVLAWHRLEEGSRPLHLFIPVFAWLIPLLNPPRVVPIGLLTPVLIFGLIAVLVALSYRAIAPTNRDNPSESNFGSCAKQIRT
ncbi:MAG TPA: glycosyltransferase family 87 protein [Rhizomicrobium sp.]